MRTNRIIKRIAAGFLTVIMSISAVMPALAEGENNSSNVAIIIAGHVVDGGGKTKPGFATYIAAEAGGTENVKAIKSINYSDVLKTTGKTDFASLKTESTAISIGSNAGVTANAAAYAWYDGNGTVYIFPDREAKVYANSQCASMFYDLYNSAAFKNLTNIDMSSIDWSHTTDLESAFYGTSSLKTIDLSWFTGSLSTAASMSSMFFDVGVTKLILPETWKFQSVEDTTGLTGNWKHNGAVYTAYAIEKEQMGGGMYELTDEDPSDNHSGIYEARGKYPNNVWSIYDRSNKFTGFCIDGYPEGVEEGSSYPGAGEISGYYLKEAWSDSKDGNGYDTGNSKVDGGYFNSDTRVTGKTALGGNMKETLITLLYYGPKVYGGSNNVIDTVDEYKAFQNCIWHYTNKYDNTVYDADKWEGKTFESIPGHDFYYLDVYRSLRGVQNMVTLRSIPVEASAAFKKVDENGAALSGAKIVIYSGTDTFNENTSKIAVAQFADDTKTFTLPVGTYTIHEIETPSSEYELASDITFTIDENGKITCSDDRYSDATKTFTMKDAKKQEDLKTTTINIKKIDDKKYGVNGANLKLTGKDINGGDVSETWPTKSENGQVVLHKMDSFPVGGPYKLEEVDPLPAGYIKADPITFSIDTNGNVVDCKKIDGEGKETALTVGEDNTISMVDDRIIVKISKIDATSKNEIGGAELKIYEGDVINKKDKVIADDISKSGKNDAEWTSVEGKTHEVQLAAGTYTLEETTAPNGYKTAESIVFTVGSDGSVTVNGKDQNGKIVMKDEKKPSPTITISKVDVNGEEIEGASLKIYEGTKPEGTPIAEWKSGVDGKTSDGKVKPHEVTLAAGTYTLHEEGEPSGYVKASDITFTVDENGKVNGKDTSKVTMTDKWADSDVVISKTDVGGTEIKGAKLTVSGTTRDNKKITDISWTSGSDGETNGKLNPHTVKLQPGTYKLTEETAPDGYKKTESITFKVEVGGKVTVDGKDNNGKVAMVDAPEYKVKKVDSTKETTYVKDAKLQLLDENGKVVEEWTTDGKDYTINADLTGAINKTYKIHEVSAPSGYKTASDISFKVENKGETITMKDAPSTTYNVVVRKVDENGDSVSGAKMQILDSDGNVVESWTTNGSSHTISVSLTKGSKYTVHEESAPDGYKIASDQTFTYSKDQTIKVVDKKKTTTTTDATYKIVVNKIDDSGNGVSGAKMQILDSSGNVVESWTTNGSSHTISSKLKSGTRYTVHESSAPDGYEVASDQTFTYSANQTIKVVDKKKTTTTTDSTTNNTTNNTTSTAAETTAPKSTETTTTAKTTTTPAVTNRGTGDAGNIGVWIGIIAVAAAGIVGFLVYKKRKNN